MNLHSQDTRGREGDETVARGRLHAPHSAPEPAALDEALDLGGLIRLALAHKRTVLLAAFLFAALAMAYVVTATRLYTATASLILQSQQGNVLAFESVVPELSSDAQAMNTELLILESTTLLGRVVDAMSLVEDPEFNPRLRPTPAWKEKISLAPVWEALGWISEPEPEPTPAEIRLMAIEILRDKLEVGIVSQTYAIEVSVVTQGAEKSARIVNKVAELYISEQLETKFTAMDDAMVWLGERVAELKGDLEAAEERVRRFAAEATVVTEEGLLFETEKLKRLRGDLETRREARDELDARVARLQELRAAGDFAALSQYTAVPELGGLAGRLAEAPQNEALQTRFALLFDSRIRQLRSEIDRTDRQIASLEEGVRDLEAELEVRSSDFVRLQQLEREAEATRLIYEHSLARMKEISIQQGIQRADARVLDPAKIPKWPSHPRSFLTVLGGGFFGGLVGLLVVFMRSALRTTIQSADELESATRLSAIGIIPAARARRPEAMLRHIIEKPAAPVAEAIRNLRTTIQLSNIDAPPQIVMLTSSVPREGKTTVSAALAQASATSGRRVLLIDADLRRRALRECFQAEKGLGLLSVLTGAASLDEAIWHDDASQMDVLFAEQGKVTAGDIFGSHRFEAFLAEIRRLYDLVVIDTAPVLAVSDTRMIAQHVDAIIYVVRWNSTEQKMIRAGLNTLRQVNAEVTGVVLNRVKATGSEKHGYYGYSYT